MRMAGFIKVSAMIAVIAGGAFAQDVITMRDGSEVQAFVVEVGDDAVKYKKWHYQDGPFFITSVSKVFSIRYRNGEKQVFEIKETPSASVPQHPLYFPVYVPQYTAPAPAAVAQTPRAPVVRGESGRMFVLSFRQESRFGSFVGVGGTFEVGVIGNSGFYFTVEGSGGGVYGGGGFNFGGTINKDGTVKIVPGVTVGNWFNDNYLNYSEYYNGYEYVYDSEGYTEGFNIGGPFLKIMFGQNGNFDITNKLLFGPGWYRSISSSSGYYYGNDLRGSATYSLSVGWTLTKQR